ncbi:MAG: hypothetical protein AAF412_12300 [Pseudomonadota bacterium]
MFGLVSWRNVCTGFSVRAGYMHAEPLTMAWDRIDEKKQHQVWAVYMETEDLRHLFNLPAVDLSDLHHRQKRT